MTSSPFTGLGVAVATPFRAPARASREQTLPRVSAPVGPRSATPAVDIEAFRAVIDHVVSGGVDFLVVLGSTGEAATVTDDERAELVRVAVDRAGSVPVVVGVGHQDTVRTCELALAARDGGAAGLLVVTPFYNKPQPAGIEAHFAHVAATVPGMPIIAYNVPGRTGTNLTATTLARLWTIPEVVAVKESSGDLRQISQMCLQAPAGKHVLAGDDDLALPAIAVGARGLISVCANVAPSPTAALVSAAMSGEMEAARGHLARLAPLMAAMFAETNPVPVKAGLAALGFGTGMVRAPLAPAEPDTWSAVHSALAGLQTTVPLGAAS